MSHADPARQHYNLTFTVLALAGATYAMLQSLVAPALPTIQHDLHTTPTAATWVLTGYLLSASVFTPIIGRLGDMYGKERMLVGVLTTLGAGTLIAALSRSIGPMIAGRVVQGAGGAVFPLAFGIIRDEFPRERVATGIALISAILGIGGGLGIVLAGPIVSGLNYHWLFWFPLIAVAITTVATHFFVPESPIKTAGRVNWTGAALLSAWLVALLLAISEGPAWGWGSGRTVGLLAGAAVLSVLWVLNERRAPEPLVDMEMMRRRGVWTVNTTAVLIGAGMFSSFVLIPQFVETPASTGYGFGATVTGAGIFLLPSTLGMLIFSPLAGRLSSTVGSRVPLLVGTLATMLSFVLLAFAHAQRWEVYVAAALMGIGIGFAFSAMANLIVEAVRPEETGVATGMNTVTRSIGGSIGGQIGASILAANLLADGFPSEHGFTLAFTLAAGALLIGLLCALAVPRPDYRARLASASGLPSSSAAPVGGQLPYQLSRAPSTVSTAPETKSPAGDAR
jgi:EmrB/QacA subfamily drug resistance transporter